MLDITVIILSYNEQKHIRRCIENVKDIATTIYVVDSFSTDDTVKIAESLGANVVQHTWPGNQAMQFNWGLKNLSIGTRWVLRLDADEYLTDELKQELCEKMPSISASVSGIILPREQDCMGVWVHPLKLLRIFEYGKGECEQRWMDEHILLTSGETVEMRHKFLDHNLNSFGWWIEKHNAYSIREAIDLLDVELQLFEQADKIQNIGKEAIAKREKKLKYARSPLFVRSFLYFIYRYIFKLHFLKGKEVFIWDFFQAWWYRTLVDVKILEIKKACGTDKKKIVQFVKEKYGIDAEIVRENL